MTRIIFLGFGNVNSHLAEAFFASEEVTIVQIYNRSLKTLPVTLKQIPFITNVSEIKEADVYIIGVPDDAIAGFSEKIPFKDRLVIHVSGGVAMEVLSENNRKGVVWPLQSFSKNSSVAIKEVPMCVEAESASDTEILKTLFSEISEKVVEISSEERAKLHLAAVFVNNFTNYLYSVSEKITIQNKIDFNLLKPLLTETASKIKHLSPKEAQTGPAKRKDAKTIEKHLHLLAHTPYQEVYRLLTEGIQKEQEK